MKKIRKPDIIVIGTSLGGFRALEVVLGGLPKDFHTPIAVVQHRHKASNEVLSSFLERASGMKVADAEDKEPIKPNRVYLAPANYHLLVEENAFALSVDEPIQYSRPSVDVLFESAADAFGDGCVGVVLTGANEDGARGAKRIKDMGGIVVVQDPDTAEAPEMPKGAIRCAKVDHILPLEKIGEYLCRLDRAVPR